MSDEVKPIQTWAVVELMGHVKSAGQVNEESHFGTVLLRLDVPEVDGMPARTEFYGGTAIYRLTPCDEQVARLVLKQNRQVPVVILELPRPQFGQSSLPFEEDELEEHFSEDDDDDRE